MLHVDDDSRATTRRSEYPDEPDDGDDDETVPCPHVRPVYEDAERCPSCGHYLSREDARGVIPGG